MAASLFLCVVVLTACSDDEDPGAGPSGQASPTAPSSTASTPSASTPADPTSGPATTAPTSAAAGGPVVELRDVTVQAPEGWSIYNQTDDQQVVFKDDATGDGLILVKNPTSLPGQDLDALAGAAVRIARGTGHDPERQANRSVGGHEGYVIVSSTKAYEKYYEWGTLLGEDQVSVGFAWIIEPDSAEETIESVLASLQFK